MKIGIIGNGFVGGATALFECPNIEVLIYDRNKSKCSKGVSSLLDLSDCEMVFICLPTPMSNDGECHTDIVSHAIEGLDVMRYNGSIFVRSTVPVGYSKSKGVSFMPEFLTEANWKEDFKNTSNWIVGARTEKDKSRIKELIQIAFDASKINSNLITFLTTDEAEMVKLVRNCFLATKVSFFNEVYDFCEARYLNYNTIIDAVIKDSRIGNSHTKVPGNNGKFGFGGTCFPKDMSSMLHQMEKGAQIKSYIVKSAIQRNDEVDSDSSWKESGRSVL